MQQKDTMDQLACQSSKQDRNNIDQDPIPISESESMPKTITVAFANNNGQTMGSARKLSPSAPEFKLCPVIVQGVNNKLPIMTASTCEGTALLPPPALPAQWN